jgi:class 3 adenylate cyclase/tetratricopeptide (TPR) repeat protein
VVGAALLADISGFTPLAEALATSLGAQRGAEELTRRLNDVYGALIAEVDRYGGSVIGFSGDAITCWFDGPEGEATHRATTAAVAMQEAIVPFRRTAAPGTAGAGIALKVAVASGPARRFRLGDAQVQYLDAVAGATLDRLAEAERQAARGEVVLDERAAAAAGDAVALREGTRVVDRVVDRAPAAPWALVDERDVAEETLRPWLLPQVHARLRAGQGDFLAELRPAVALFLLFGGIDFDGDDKAGDKLDRFVRWVQGVLARYEGTLVDITIGDKGSYLYCAFGAPTAHEDDADRALRAALDLRAPPADLGFEPRVRIGVSRGRTRAGPIGGPTRRAYAVTGRDVNVAARLMQAAEMGEVLVSEHVLEGVRGRFARRKLPPMTVKGRGEPLRVVALTGVEERHTGEGRAAGPMVGREAELALALERMDNATRGAGQIVAVVAEAGMGKSRLLAEVVRAARGRGLAVHVGEAQAFGSMAAYLAWQGVFRGVFGIDGGASPEDQKRALEAALGALDPALVQRLPLLGPAVGIAIPDSDLTRQFEAKLRKDSLEALLATCLRAAAARAPRVLVVEDAHWLDPLSADLLESLGRAIAGMPVALVITCRPQDRDGKRAAARVAQLPHFTEIALDELTRADTATLVERAVRARFGDATPVPEPFVEMLSSRAEHNPFLVEELVGLLHDRGVTPERALSLEPVELPTGLASAILGRIDRLTATQQTTLRIASVIGRSYRADWLWGAHPDLGDAARVRDDLGALSRLDLVQPDGESRWTFRHSTIQEVAYDSLPFATRAKLHGQLAAWLETGRGGDAGGGLDILAFHYGRSDSQDKQREYFRKAGDAAAARYANDAAAEYYERLEPLVEIGELPGVLLDLGTARQRISRWDEAERHFRRGLDLLGERDDRRPLRASLASALGQICAHGAAYNEAHSWFQRARDEYVHVRDPLGESAVLIETANAYRLQGDLARARSVLEESLRMAGERGDEAWVARAYHVLGNVMTEASDLKSARKWMHESLRVRRKLGDKPGIASMLLNTAVVAFLEHGLDEASALLSETLVLCNELGMTWEGSRANHLLALTLAANGDTTASRRLMIKNLTILRDLGAMREMAELMASMLVSWRPDDTNELDSSLRIAAAGARLFEDLGIPMPPPLRARVDRAMDEIRAHLGSERADSSWSMGRSMSWVEAIAYAQGHLAR